MIVVGEHGYWGDQLREAAWGSWELEVDCEPRSLRKAFVGQGTKIPELRDMAVIYSLGLA